MEKGFNSDIQVGLEKFHVQTEDWGQANPYIVSRVFRDGAVITSLKTSYSEVLTENLIKSPPAIRLAMKVQHEQILDLLVSGHFQAKPVS